MGIGAPAASSPVPIMHELGWALQPVWTGWKISPPPEFDPRTVQLVAIRHTDWAIPAHVLSTTVVW
jgi:hypothetical protein